jgi:hypothetical protein
MGNPTKKKNLTNCTVECEGRVITFRTILTVVIYFQIHFRYDLPEGSKLITKYSVYYSGC